MKFNDLNKFLSEAIDKAQPVDEAHRVKLERLRAMISEGNANMRAAMEEITRVQESLSENDAPRRAQLRSLANESTRLALETSEGLAAAFEEQSEIISRIGHD